MYRNLFGQYSILYPILCTLTTIFYQTQDFSPVSPLNIFSTICSPQYCFSHLFLARMNFLSLFHFTAFLSFFFYILFFPAAFLMLTVLFLICLEQGRYMFHCLFFFNSSPFLAFILLSSLHCLSLLLHQPDLVVQANTIALDSGKHVLSSYECQV